MIDRVSQAQPATTGPLTTQPLQAAQPAQPLTTPVPNEAPETGILPSAPVEQVDASALNPLGNVAHELCLCDDTNTAYCAQGR